jgi:hypothetical protein
MPTLSVKASPVDVASDVNPLAALSDRVHDVLSAFDGAGDRHHLERTVASSVQILQLCVQAAPSH